MNGNYLWLIMVRINRREKREIRIMAQTTEDAYREAKRQFPSCHIISQRRPSMTLYPIPESVN